MLMLLRALPSLVVVHKRIINTTTDRGTGEMNRQRKMGLGIIVARIEEEALPEHESMENRCYFLLSSFLAHKALNRRLGNQNLVLSGNYR
jgi:hypothetical protein